MVAVQRYSNTDITDWFDDDTGVVIEVTCVHGKRWAEGAPFPESCEICVRAQIW